MKIPFVDLFAQYETIKPEIDEAINSVIQKSAFVRGEFVEKFEEEYSIQMGTKHCISCANGTDALYIAMKALDIKPGDEVITTAQSWISTSETVSQHGATPVFVDIDPVTHTIDADLIAKKITEKTVGVIPVHLYGQSANLKSIKEICDKHSLWLVEDCAQAHLAEHHGKLVGTYGDMATWSFYPGKNLGAMGDAGAITTNDPSLATTAAKFARHGGIVKGEHEIEGINSRMDGIQAAILSVKLTYLPRWTQERKTLASKYDRELGKLNSVITPSVLDENSHVYHLYVIQSPERDSLKEELASMGVPTVINYKQSLPFLPAYSRFQHLKSDFPATAEAQQKILSLPIFPEMTPEQQDYIIDCISKLISR